MKQLSKSYMLRTGQMRLPMRAIKPVTQQMLVVKNQLPAIPSPLPDFPIIGEYYTCKGKNVQCVESGICKGCVNVNISSCDLFYKKCKKFHRRDGKSVIFIKAD